MLTSESSAVRTFLGWYTFPQQDFLLISTSIDMVPAMSNKAGIFDSESQIIKQRRMHPVWLFNRPGKQVEAIAPRPQTSSIWRMKLSTVSKVLFSLTLLTIFIWAVILLVILPKVHSSVPTINNGYHAIASEWVHPASGQQASSWPNDLSGGINSVPVHSHNDYERRVPLFDALSVGCQGVEADVWLNNNELLVGHTERSLKPDRTLRSLYLDPLFRILVQQNEGLPPGGRPYGVYSTSPNETLILLIDIKSDGSSTLPTISSQLAPLRSKGYLTLHNGTDLITSALTIVATGTTPFSAILNNTIPASFNSTTTTNRRDIFFDAPLDSLSAEYNSSNSLYASAPLSPSIGKLWFLGGLSRNQRDTVKEQTKRAAGRGLRARYWDTPSWPVAWRNRAWRDLVRSGIGKEGGGGERRIRGVINADDVFVASRWDWDWCSVWGVNVC